jgi:formylglycine-generating enzyme required for sulfatase activity
MLSHRVLVASCLGVGALTVNPIWAQAPKPKDGPLGIKFVPLPKATFYMGWNGEKGSAKKTEIKEDFEIAIHTVTQGQWQEMMGNNPSWFSRDGKGKDQVKDIKDEDLKHFPVEMVSWNDAQEFIKKLNEKEKGKGYQYRLPSEAEWEYACRGGATSEEECSYHFYFAKATNDLSSKEANFKGEYPYGKADKGPYLGRTTKVGSYAPNKLGLYDMHGNVWQWCEDLVGGSDRVPRGGGWNAGGISCLAAFRYGHAPTLRSLVLGFRLARIPVRKPAPQASRERTPA